MPRLLREIPTPNLPCNFPAGSDGIPPFKTTACHPEHTSCHPERSEESRLYRVQVDRMWNLQNQGDPSLRYTSFRMTISRTSPNGARNTTVPGILSLSPKPKTASHWPMPFLRSPSITPWETDLFPDRKGSPPRFGGLIIMLSKDEFLVAGSGLIVTFAPRSGNAVAGIASLDEGVFADGKWVPGRRLNGDQSHQGRHLHLPGNIFGIQKARLYLYKS